MKFGVIGTGVVGKTIGGKLAALGHDVVIGTRDVTETLARTAPGMYGDPPIAEWQKEHPVRVVTFAEAADHAEILVLATAGAGTLPALALAGADRLGDKVVMDISNPLDFSKGMPPSLLVCNDDSLGEQIQRAYPRLRVVKTLNTVTAPVMADARLVNGGEHTLFVSGNDAAAKTQVSQIVREGFGWRHVLDLGDITTARGTEMLLPLWVRIYGATGDGMFGFHIVR